MSGDKSFMLTWSATPESERLGSVIHAVGLAGIALCNCHSALMLQEEWEAYASELGHAIATIEAVVVKMNEELESKNPVRRGING